MPEREGIIYVSAAAIVGSFIVGVGVFIMLQRRKTKAVLLRGTMEKCKNRDKHRRTEQDHDKAQHIIDKIFEDLQDFENDDDHNKERCRNIPPLSFSFVLVEYLPQKTGNEVKISVR